MSQVMELDPAALEAEGRTEEALALLPSEVGSLTPNQALLAGRCVLRRPDPVGAIPYFERATVNWARQWEQVEAHRALGRIRTGLGQDLMAAHHYFAILDLRPEDAEASFLLGRAYAQLGWNDLANAAFRTLAQPLPGWWAAIARATRRTIAAARQSARNRLAARRKGAGIPEGAERALLAIELLRCGRLRAAQGLVAQRPDDPAMRPVAAQLALRLGRAVEADCVPRGLPPRLRIEGARALLQSGQAKEAEAALAGLSEGALGEAGRLLRARAMLLRGAKAELLGLSRVAVKAAPQDSWAARLWLTAAAQTGTVPVWRAAAPAAPRRVPLVQFWHEATPPADVAAAMDSWPRLNPGLELARFDAATARAEMAKHGLDPLLAVYDTARHPAMQSDIFRLVFLYLHGGIWVDADERCIAPAEGLVAQARGLALGAVFSDEIPYYLLTGVLLAEAGSPVLERALRDIAARAAAPQPKPPSIWDMTGPGLVTRSVAGHVAAGGGEVAAICLRLWRLHAETAEDLAYKKSATGDWRRA